MWRGRRDGQEPPRDVEVFLTSRQIIRVNTPSSRAPVDMPWRNLGPAPDVPTASRGFTTPRFQRRSSFNGQNWASRAGVGSRIVAADYGKSIKPADYKEGMIIWTTQVEVDSDQFHSKRDENHSTTEDGTRVHEKNRQVLTYGGKGILDKDNEEGYVSIRERDQEDLAPAQSKHPIIWADTLASLKQSGKNWNRMNATTVVDITNPRDHKLTFPAVLMGWLEPESLIALKKLVAAQLLGIDAPDELRRPPVPLAGLTPAEQGAGEQPHDEAHGAIRQEARS
ncbi:hypothetical protein BJ875DRAFT_480131 [Amylocarpus encephaloides]|uniref:Uncharacterized protein n=1 Tax=Amylocarpus encephaloides TaxID=45428 RepID=A0A9P7YS43_9HELO|nr:hypothetical protein BJ875DRAFT_480131 [Amylocarpus encephaloides]